MNRDYAMSNADLAAKQAYFDEQKLLDISDDEASYDDGVAMRLDVQWPR